MLYKQIKLITFLLFVFGLGQLHAQEAIPATGSNASGIGGSVSYTLGQVFYRTQTGVNGAVAEGVQQPYEISVITAIEEAEKIIFSVTAYPNPTKDNLTLSISEFDISGLTYQLYNLQGSILQSENITNPKTNINMSNFVPASYFLKVKRDNIEIKTFKIIKNQ